MAKKTKKIRVKTKRPVKNAPAAKAGTDKNAVIDVAVKAVIIAVLAAAAGLAYSGVKNMAAKQKAPAQADVMPVPAVEAVNTPVPVTKPALVSGIPERYRHLFRAIKTKEEMPKIQIEEAKVLFASGKALFVDARGANEFTESHIKGAVSIPAGTPPEKIKEMSGVLKNKILVSYCHGAGCHMADKTANALFDEGYRKVIIFFGGWPEWTQAGMPVQNYEPPAEFKHLFTAAVSESAIPEITLAEAKFLYDSMKANMFDADDIAKYNELHIDRAISLPSDKIAENLQGYGGMLAQKPVVLYSHGSDDKAKDAAAKLFKAGYKNILIFPGALTLWEAAAYPVYKLTKQ